MDIRVGHGFDSHRLTSGRPLILAGVNVPYHKGLDGVSDADVIAHAVIDAILGATGLGNIGQHFPESTSRDADSMNMLRETAVMAGRAGFQFVNADITVIAESPKLAPYLDEMKNNIARAINIPADCVGIKPKTNEGMGFTGRGEGMAAFCVLLANRSG